MAVNLLRNSSRLVSCRKYQGSTDYIRLLQCVTVNFAILKTRDQKPIFVSSCGFKIYVKNLTLHHGIPSQSNGSTDNVSYEAICETTLDSLAEFFEEFVATFNDPDVDVTLSSGVLTVNLGKKHGTYVINKQAPNRQIWLSSPMSGPKRYDFVSGTWIYKRDGISMHQLLGLELSKITGTAVDLTNACYGKYQSS